MQQVAPINAPAELQRAVEVLGKNWILAIPTAIASLVVALLAVFVLAAVLGSAALGAAAGGHTGGALAALGSGLLGTGLIALVGTALNLLAGAVVMNSSEDAWNGRQVDLARSFGEVGGKLGQVLLALILCFLIILIPLALSAFFIGIPLLLIAGFFLMYVMPAVIIGGESATEAIGTSYRIARANVVPSIIALVGIIVATIVFGILNGIAAHIPILNLVVPFLIGGFTAAYSALVAARFYDLLRGTAALPAAYAAPIPPPPSV